MSGPLGLQKIEGPSCPRCGCQDSIELRSGRGWSGTWVKRQCQYCGRIWTATGQDQKDNGKSGKKKAAGHQIPVEATDQTAIEYPQIHCPQCDSKNTTIARTARPFRYHRCRSCGARFKSCER